MFPPSVENQTSDELLTEPADPGIIEGSSLESCFKIGSRLHIAVAISKENRFTASTRLYNGGGNAGCNEGHDKNAL